MLEPRAPRRCPLATATTPRAGGIRGSSDGLAEIGSSEIGLAEIGSSEIGSSEIGLAEIGIAEIGSSEIGLAEIGSSENGLAEIGSSEVGSSEVGIAEIGSSHRPERHQARLHSPPEPGTSAEGHRCDLVVASPLDVDRPAYAVEPVQAFWAGAERDQVVFGDVQSAIGCVIGVWVSAAHHFFPFRPATLWLGHALPGSRARVPAVRSALRPQRESLAYLTCLVARSVTRRYMSPSSCSDRQWPP